MRPGLLIRISGNLPRAAFEKEVARLRTTYATGGKIVRCYTDHEPSPLPQDADVIIIANTARTT